MARDLRFVAVHRGGLLALSDHRLLASWAADCAEHVLPLFTAKYPDDDRPSRAIEAARRWSRGEATVGEAREAATAAHAAARSVTDPVAQAVCRAAGHAAGTAHMADHELGAAAYAIKAVRLATEAGAGPDPRCVDQTEAGRRECQWQRERLPGVIRELVLSDQERRNSKFWSVFV